MANEELDSPGEAKGQGDAAESITKNGEAADLQDKEEDELENEED